MARKYTTGGRIGNLLARGAKLTEDHASAVLSGDISLSMQEVSQLSLTFSDPDMKLLGSRLFDPPKQAGKSGSALDYGGLKFEVAAVEVGESAGTVTLGVTARSLGVQKLRRPFDAVNAPAINPVTELPPIDPGDIAAKHDPDYDIYADEVARSKALVAAQQAGQARGLSPTAYLKIQAKHVGLKFVGQDTAIYQTIGPTMNDQTKRLESLWEVAQRLAKEVGFVVFEAAGTLYFGQPTWLVRRTPRIKVEWDGSKTASTVIGVPTCRRTGDDPANQNTATIEVTLSPEAGEKALPGMAFDLAGVPTFNGRYIVTDVAIPLADNTTVRVSAATPENPEPDPPAPAPGATTWDGLVDNDGNPILADGTYGGVHLTMTQTGYAAIIYRTGKQVGMTQNDQIMAIMCALQESSLTNLSGGDRDSVGLFQQRPSQGWGSPAQLSDPVYASTKFYNALKGQNNRDTRNRSEVIQSVQRSAFPDAYTRWEDCAVALVRALDDAILHPAGGAAGATGTAEAFVQYALGQVGDRYILGAQADYDDSDPDAFDCSELVEWALMRAGNDFGKGDLNSVAMLAKAKRLGTTISVDEGLKLRGALLFRMTGNPTHVSISLGDNGRTIEAVGREYGVKVMGPNRSFSWTHAARVPGLSYGGLWTPPLPAGHKFGDKPNER
jgi:hypothetical protein